MMLVGLIMTVYAALATGVNAAVTGDKRCGKMVCVTGTHDSATSVEQYTLELAPNALTSGGLGWMAIGFGTSMVTSSMVIVWSSSQGGVVLSQRTPNGRNQPTVPATLSRRAELNNTISHFNSSSVRAVFSLPATSSSGGSTNLIWATSPDAPSSDAVDATIRQHTEHGYLTLDLSKSISNGTASPTTSSVPTSNNDDGDSSSTADADARQRVLLAHAVCGALAAMLIIPSMVLVPRIARGLTRKRWWFPIHAAGSGMLGMGLVLAAFLIAITQFDGEAGPTHRTMGKVLFVAMCLQVLLGIGVHWIKVPNHRFMTSSGRGWSNLTHIIIGVFIMAFGWGTVWTGMDNWDMSSASRVGRGWKIGWIVVVAIWGASYLAGLIFLLPRQLRAEREARSQSNIDKDGIGLEQTRTPGSGAGEDFRPLGSSDRGEAPRPDAHAAAEPKTRAAQRS